VELRVYWQVFLRRWWIAASLTTLVAVISFAASPLAQGSYLAPFRVLVTLPAQPPGAFYTYDRYYTFLSTEYLTDDVIEVVRSQAFHEAVRAELGSSGSAPFSPSRTFSIASQARTERAARVISVTVSSNDLEQVRLAAEAATRVLKSRLTDFLPTLVSSGVSITVIDPPVAQAPTTGGRNYLNVALRAALGLIAGLGLIFLLHYLDTTLYNAEEAGASLGLEVLAAVPPYGDQAT